jgi:hypothetical protein
MPQATSTGELDGFDLDPSIPDDELVRRRAVAVHGLRFVHLRASWPALTGSKR